MEWLNAKESKPSQGERVLLKIAYEDCPVVGYWGCGVWEVCTVNLYIDCSYYEDAEIAGNFEQNQVTHYAYITDIPE